MKLWVKTLIYEIVTALALAWAVWRCALIGSADMLVAQGGLRSGEMTLLVLGCILLGMALYGGRAYARRDKTLKADVWFGAGVGVLLLIGWFLFFWTYGGLTSVVTAAGVRARNGMIVAMSLLPLPFEARAGVLAFFGKEDDRAKRLIVRVIAAALLLVYVVLIVFGGLMNTLPVPAALS